MRVVSLCPSNTDIVGALDLGHWLVGVDRWSLRDPSLRERIPSLRDDVVDVGTDLHIDIDAVSALRPDIVLASLSVPGMEDNIARLEERGLPFIIVDSGNLAAVRRGISQVAGALQAAAAGQKLLDAFDAAIEDVRSRSEQARRQFYDQGCGHELPRRAAWEWWPKPVIVAGRRSWIHDMFAIVGLENAFGDIDKESSPVETGAVLEKAPDTYFACWAGSGERRMSVTEIAMRPGWDRLPAVQLRRVFLLPERLFGRPGPYLADGLRELYEILYGDRAAATRRSAEVAGLPPAALNWPQ